MKESAILCGLVCLCCWRLELIFRVQEIFHLAVRNTVRFEEGQNQLRVLPAL